MRSGSLVLGLAALIVGCAAVDTPETPREMAFEAGSAEEVAILAVANDPEVGFTILDVDVGLDRRAAENMVAHRDGADGAVGGGDDDLFDDIDELDGVSYVGKTALQSLLDYAIANGYYEGDEWGRERMILAVVNSLDEDTLDDDVALDGRAAANILERRLGPDGVADTRDDRIIMSLAELDAISYVGNSAIAKISDYARDNGFGQLPWDVEMDAIFSPQPYADSHNVRVADLIDGAQDSLDIAMYSFSDEGIYDALEAATARGVKVRFIFETASEDRKLDGQELADSRSARLEDMGINVRWVNKIMHHKFVIVDGPRDDLSLAGDATVASGSGNWSYGAATKYDENTVVYTGLPGLTLRLQREFNLLWEHSRDFVWDATLPYELGAPITDADLPSEPWTDAYFTSANFSPNGDTFSIVTGRNEVSDQLVDAILNATDSIYIASGHLRSRPVSEALIERTQQLPDLDVRVYLDGQEYISSWYHGQQLEDLEDCLVAAGSSESKIRKCYDSGFYFGYQLGELDGVPVRYKYYSYRWHYRSALQMHHKFLIIDGDELWTGSYNLSNNAEHNTFENILVFRGWELAPLFRAYQKNFSELWTTRRGDGTYEDLLDEVENADDIPLIFDSMSLEWSQITDLKAAIKANCSVIDTEPYRTEPWKHDSCPRE